MALSFSHIRFLYELRKLGHLPAAVRMVEFGEQNWYGDVPANGIMETATAFLPAEQVPAIADAIDRCIDESQANMTKALFDLAGIFYRTLFTIERYDAIDLHGTPRALAHDLNHPLPITDKYNFVTNFGTGEHVFNQYSFFQNMHDVTEPGGLMLHSMPNQGCYDHGFFNYHPTFIFDLAHANGYEIVSAIYADLTQKPPTLHLIDRVRYVEMAVANQLSNYSALLVCLRKTGDAPFTMPQQGYYSNHLPDQLRQAWERLAR
jgi:SAM-dependent methyltransferase